MNAPGPTAAGGAGRIRVGVVGAGENTRERHLPGLQAQAGVELVSVCNRRRSSAEAVAAAFHIPRVYDRWEDLVAAPHADAILIGTWPYLHAPVTLAALEAGKHVLCEARMAMNLEEARQMLAASRRHPHLVAQVVPAPFTLGVDRTVQRLIAEGYLGRLLAIEVRANSGAFLDLDGPLTWRRDVRLSGGNIMSLGIWYETLMRWVGEAQRVTALGKVFVATRVDPATGAKLPVQIPEHLDVLADWAGGAQAHVQISSVHGLATENTIHLFGSEGTLRFSGGALSGGRHGAQALEPIAIPPGEAGGWRVEEEFVNAIRHLEPVRRTDFAAGVRYMAFTEAVNRSLREGRPVAVEP
jgi:predicted dehydrogenase